MKKKMINLALVLALTLTTAVNAGACGAGSDKGTESAGTESTEAGSAAASATSYAEYAAAMGLDASATDWLSNEVASPEDSDNHRTYYEIFVYSFYDSDGDGIGDLNGVREKLDYIQDLGFTGIWLMPIMPSPTYHKYDTTDYYGIDEQYGTLDDFQALLAECHERNIKVIIDLAINHTSSEHPWFQEAYEYIQSLGEGEEPDLSVCPYVEYYNFTQSAGSTGYSPVEGTTWSYEAQFWSGMPDLNWDCQAVRDEIENVANYWLDMGVDGFRLDAVKYYYYNDDAGCEEVLTWFNDIVKANNPNAYIVCENWSDQTAYAPYYATGVDSLFDFKYADATGTIKKAACGMTTAVTFGNSISNAQALYESYNPNAIDAPFYTNHDTARAAGHYSGDYAEAQLKMAWTLNLITSGCSFLYYGEELGMKGSGIDENKRAPMYWSTDADAEGMCDGPEAMEDFDMLYGSYEEQSSDYASLYNYIKTAILLRNQNPEISHGETECLECSTDEICVLRKTYNGSEVLVIICLAKEGASVDLSGVTVNGTAAGDATIAGELFAYGMRDTDLASAGITIEGSSVTMSPYSVLVIR